MEDDFKYLFAEKKGRTLCLKYNCAWELSMFDYLVDKGYKLQHSSEAHWNRQHDEIGRPVEAYLLDDDLKEFDIGSW